MVLDMFMIVAKRNLSSGTMCPKAASGIEKLSIWIPHSSNADRNESAYAYLDQLIDKTFLSPDTPHYRRKQLANVSKVEVCLAHCIELPPQQCQTITRLMAEFQRLQCVEINSSQLMPWISIPWLQQMICKDVVTPQQLQAFVNKHPSIQRLEFECKTPFESFKQQLLALTALKHLHLESKHDGSLLDASLFVDVTTLATLSLHRVVIKNVHLVRRLHISHLTLGKVETDLTDQQLVLPAQWPSLQSVELKHVGCITTPLTETLARAILPLPHPGFSVTWPECFNCYHADVPPHPQFGYMGVLHMTSNSHGYTQITGQYIKDTLRAMVRHKVTMGQLILADGPLELTKDDLKSCLAFPTMFNFFVKTLSVDTPETLVQLFQQCPRLQLVTVPAPCLSEHVHLPSSLRISRGEPYSQVRRYI